MMQIGMRLGFPWINQNTKCPTRLFNFADGTNVLSPSINFSRTTNATVTNSAGQITYAPHNLLTYSEQFDNAAWAKNGANITANSILSPNSNLTADSLVEDTTTGDHRTYQGFSLTSGLSYSFSVYIKKSGRDLIQLSAVSGLSATTTFNINTGVITNTVVGTASISDVGNGWYRCSVSNVAASSGVVNFQIRLVNTGTNTSYTGDGTSGVYLWGAQLEIGSTATTYNSTTVKNLLGFSELFDNAAWTKSNSFVQTNSVTFSEAFDNASWTKINSAVTSNDVVAPNGYQTADKITANAGLGRHQIFEVPAITIANVPYTSSVYLKQGTNRYAYLVFGSNAANSNVWAAVVVDLQTGLITQTSNGAASSSVSSVVSPANNGFYRVSLTQTMSTTDTFVGIYLSDVATPSIAGYGVYSFTATGTETIYAWGAQLVQGSVAGDYRRTDAAALPVYYPNHNGVVCAEKLVENVTTGLHSVTIVGAIASGVQTLSVYAKAGERTQLALQASNVVVAYFNLATGTVISGAGASIQSVGNGWYRCSVTATYGANVTSSIYTAVSGAVSTTGDGTSGIYIFGAQLSDSASLDPYVLNAAAAPTAAAYYGPRFDYDPVTLAPKGLLIEEQRSNLILYSEQFDNADWVKLRASISANSITSPNGTQVADTIIEDTSSNSHFVYKATVPIANATAYTYTMYAKAKERNWLWIDCYDGVSRLGFFNLTTGAVGSTSGITSSSITPAGNGWYRCSITWTSSSTVTSPSFGTATANNVTNYQGDGTSGIYIWGAQLEAGAFATSYIPTAASQVTRAADVATIQGSNFYSWYNRGEGTINSTYFFAAPTSGSINKVLAFDPIAAGSYATICVAGGAQTGWFASGLSMPTASAGVINKQAIAYNSWGGFSGALNNVLATSSTTSDYTGASTALYLGQRSNGQYMNGTIKQISYYPQRLSNETLKGLTA